MPSETPSDPQPLEAVLRPSSDPGQSKMEDAFALISDENVKLRDRLLEERFGWIVVCFVLFNAAILANFQTWTAALSVLVPELLLLILLARRFGLEQVTRLVDRIIEGYAGKGNGKNGG